MRPFLNFQLSKFAKKCAFDTLGAIVIEKFFLKHKDFHMKKIFIMLTTGLILFATPRLQAIFAAAVAVDEHTGNQATCRYIADDCTGLESWRAKQFWIEESLNIWCARKNKGHLKIHWRIPACCVGDSPFRDLHETIEHGVVVIVEAKKASTIAGVEVPTVYGFGIAPLNFYYGTDTNPLRVRFSPTKPIETMDGEPVSINIRFIKKIALDNAVFDAHASATQAGFLLDDSTIEVIEFAYF